MLKGVFKAKKKSGEIYYRSNITYRDKHISLGSFKDEEKAHEAYVYAREILDNPVFLFNEWVDNGILSFEKVISLFNLRDNGVYIKTPIYLRTNYFSYFLSPDMELKFDVDDLFYYSSHKIMVRKGHYFVSDYGMQVSILSRYGIFPYAAQGRDYVFINGDVTDFRYSNIHVINPYFGVRMGKKDNVIYFDTYLHLKGDWKIGRYDTAQEAAIAYNKARDLAIRAGIKKEFIENYVAISEEEYAKMYDRVRISERFMEYLTEIS